MESTKYETEAEKDKGCWSYQNSNFEKDLNWRNPGYKQDYKHPVTCVSWNEAVAYTKWLSKETGEKYRFPTEAEWEYVARAGTTTPFHTGECITTKQANFNGNYTYGDCPKTDEYWEKTVEVGTYPANKFGLCDTAGNVCEWVNDWHKVDYDASSPLDNSQGPAKDLYLVFRGGGWSDSPFYLRSASRTGVGTDVYSLSVGFRLARQP